MPDTIRQLPKQLSALRTAFELVCQPVFVVNSRQQRVVDANPAACATLGIARAELIGSDWLAMAKSLPKFTQCDVDGRHFVAVAHELALEAVPIRPVLRDTLTGVASREELRLRMMRDDRKAPLEPLGLLFVDLDEFKQVNDTWGHPAGDRVLRIVAERVADCIRPSDLLVRYGGDEFVLLVEGARRRRDLQCLARRISRGIRQPILLGSHEYMPSASIGFAIRNSRVQTITALVAEADCAMYRAKARRNKPAAPGVQTEQLLGWPII